MISIWGGEGDDSLFKILRHAQVWYIQNTVGLPTAKKARIIASKMGNLQGIIFADYN